MRSNGGATGDSFQDMIEPVTSAVPYMGNEGNHESASAFQHYSNRFRVFSGDNSSGLTPPISGLTAGPNNHWWVRGGAPVFDGGGGRVQLLSGGPRV